MKRFLLSAAWAVACIQALALLSGCGASASLGGAGAQLQQPHITSFTPGNTSIEAGTSTTLTALFNGGTGVVTPGNASVTSGTPVTVTPATTTTYTLTVTGSSGTTPAMLPTTVVVDSVPAISSFTAGAGAIEAGSSTTLTATFAGGTGTITPGNITVSSGTAVTVKPASTTIYTLTVTGLSGTTPATQTTTIVVDPAPVISSFTAGANAIEAGTSTTLTATFIGGTGMITPGNISVTSGTPVTVIPAGTATYTLTVSPPVGAVTATQTATVTVDSVPTITSFMANPNPATSGGSLQLTAVFAGGTGVITGPSNLSTPVSSGTAVSVTAPTTTTITTVTYKLTVMPPVGMVTAAQNAIVTVNPGAGSPTIVSFTANPNPVVAGSNISLTATFTGGTGMITPGNITVTSGTPVSVSTTGTTSYTTTYTLTVTPAAGSAITQTTTVTLDPAVTVCVSASCSGPAVSSLLMGMNMAVWYDDIANASSIVPAFESAGITALRWPGASTADDYHWNSNNANPANGVAPTPSVCPNSFQNQIPDTNYLNFIQDIEYGNTSLASGFDIALTANYGTNPTCNGGGEPSEAANWVQYAYANGGTVSYVTVGNEPYGSWEDDLHAVPHDPTTYANAVKGPSGYYNSIKNQSPSTKVGVVVDADCMSNNDCTDGWDATVLADDLGYYDFVEYHFYPVYGDQTSDTVLVQQGALIFTYGVNVIKSELATAGAAGTPIYIGEVGANAANPGTQSWSISQGLFAGQLLGEAMNDGISRLTWWTGFGDCWGPGNNAPTLYGWQNTWGASNIFSDGSTDGAGNCTGEGPIGTMSPTAQAFNLFQYVVNAANAPAGGESTLQAAVLGDTTDVRAYAATHSGGTALMLFNLNETTAETVSLSLTGSSQTSSSDVQVITYDKAIYDKSNPALAGGTVWVPPITTDLGQQTLPMTLTLQPWSMNVVIVQP